MSELRSCPPQLWPGACSDYLCHLKEVRREQYSQGRITSDVPAPLEIQAIRDLVRARGREMQAENFNAHALVAAQVCMDLVRASCTNRLMACPTPVVLDLQVDAALSAEQLRQSLRAAFQQKQWQWTYLLRMAMTFMPATLGRSDDLRKLPWSCLALRTQDNGPMPSVAILFGSMQGKTVKPGQVDIPGVVRYVHSCCQTLLGSVQFWKTVMLPLPQVSRPLHLSSGSACRPGCRHLPQGHQT